VSVAAAPVSRNAPCPCGSGRRYRDCHGAIAAVRPEATSLPASTATYLPEGPDWNGVDPSARGRLSALMEAALARQAVNDQAGAARLYGEVLAVAPDTHDALHMLAVAEWGLGDLEGAWRTLERAFALREPYPAILANRDTLQRARWHQAKLDARRATETAARERLAAFASRMPAAVERMPLPPEVPLHLILGTGDPDDDAVWLADRLMHVLAPWGPALWVDDGGALAGMSRPACLLRPDHGEFPTEGMHIHVGLDLVGRMGWLARAAPRRVVAVGVRARASDWLAGLTALARDGNVPVLPVFVTSAEAARFGVPGPVLPCLEASSLTPPVRHARRWTLGVVAGNGRPLDAVPDGPLLRRIAMSGIAVAIRSPGGLRYQLGEMPDVRFEPRTARPIDAFVADVDALLVPKRSPDNEGVEREIDLALLSRRPVVVRQSSNHAPRVRAAAGGRLVSDDDEAFDAVIALARAEDVPPARAPGSAEERLESARQSFGAALALGARRLAS
jgi:hypothetical protein